MFPIEFCIGVSRSANETLNSWYYGRRLFRDCVCPTALTASRRMRTSRLILIRLTAYREALYSYYFAHTDFPWLYNIMVGLWVLVKGNNANNEWHLFICFSFYFIFILFFSCNIRNSSLWNNRFERPIFLDSSELCESTI